jgi:hypothetical protein
MMTKDLKQQTVVEENPDHDNITKIKRNNNTMIKLISIKIKAKSHPQC